MKNQIAAIRLFKKLSMYVEISGSGVYTLQSHLAFRSDIKGVGDGSLSIDRIDIPDSAWVDRVEGGEAVFVNALGIETKVPGTLKDHKKDIVLSDSTALSKDEKRKIKWLIDACAKPNRPNIASIALSPKHGFVATDGYRLHSWRPDFAVSCHEDIKTVSPDILHILKKPERFELMSGGIYAESSDGLSGVFPWLDLVYPDIDRLFCRFSDKGVSMETDLWDPRKDKETIKSAAKLSGTRGIEPIVMHPDRTEFGGKNIGFLFKAKNVRLNPKYLDRVVGDYSCFWHVVSRGNEHPVLFRSEGGVNSDRKALVMTMRR